MSPRLSKSLSPRCSIAVLSPADILVDPRHAYKFPATLTHLALPAGKDVLTGKASGQHALNGLRLFAITRNGVFRSLLGVVKIISHFLKYL
jgi:hypothetical protein